MDVPDAGFDAKLFKSKNGGQIWKKVYQDKTNKVFLCSMVFKDKLNGIAIGDPIDGKAVILHTSTAGDRWSELDKTCSPQLAEGEAFFAASRTCLYVISNKVWMISGGKEARVFISQDFGLHWETINTNMIQGLETQGIFSICMIDQKRGMIVGGDYKNPNRKDRNIATTNDGGLNWVTISNSSPNGYRSCVDFITVDDLVVWVAVGISGCDYSIDMGNSWFPITDEGFNTVKFQKGSNKGFLVNSQGEICSMTISLKK
jgi:photosystem II stability/assembly factor-like uncharacterized protein